jgi:hypothetical protein
LGDGLLVYKVQTPSLYFDQYDISPFSIQPLSIFL